MTLLFKGYTGTLENSGILEGGCLPAKKSRPKFVKRQFNDYTQSCGVTEVSAQVVCAEKPDVASVGTILSTIVDAAPHKIRYQLKAISGLRQEWDRAAFNNKYSSVVALKPVLTGSISWRPPNELIDGLKAMRLLSNDGINESDSWFDAFTKQVAAVRLCHVRQISKKGVDLDGKRHFDGALRGKCHPSYQGRIKAAFEVLCTGNLPVQARELLRGAVQRAGYTGRGALRLHCMRPVKDYAVKTNSYNFLTATYARILRNNIAALALRDYPGWDIRVVDEPVMMLTTTNRTDADSLGRLIKQPLFEIGDVAGKHVIITDDHVNAGAFTATLISQAEAAGAKVVGVAAFSRHPHSRNLVLQPKLKDALLALHPQEELNALLGRIGLSLDTLTNREGLTLLSMMAEGADPAHVALFESTMTDINGEHGYLLDGIGDNLDEELRKPAKTPAALARQIDALFREGPVR